MLKEERRLRQSVLVCARPCEHCKGIEKEINSLVQAVREDCAKLGGEAIRNCMKSPKIEVQVKVVDVMANYVETVIRETK